jgi:hypothetical protein
MTVFVLDKRKQPLMDCSEKRARKLLTKKRAVVHKMEPFTIRLKDRLVNESSLQPLHLKLDPGSKITGVAVLAEKEGGLGKVIYLAELHHKTGIKDKLLKRKIYRKGRRNKNLRYRKPRFLNRKKLNGWLPPSLEARVEQTLNMTAKLRSLLPIKAISTEHVKFDTQRLANPEISGVEYQQGTLLGYEVREYLLEKFNRKCAYCEAENTKLEVEHYYPKSKGGSDRVSNLTLACRDCNEDKDNHLPVEWIAKLKSSANAIDERRLMNFVKLNDTLKKPLKDAAIMNATRWRLYELLKATGLSVDCGSGARTKYNRTQQKLPKTHYYDACCVADTPEKLVVSTSFVTTWKALGRGVRQMANLDKYGFPKSHRQNKKNHFGFQTGDLVTASVPQGKYQGAWQGKVAVRKSGYFDLKDVSNKRISQGVNYKFIKIIQRGGGWQYGKAKVS